MEARMETMVKGLPEVMKQHLCPRCRSAMAEIDRIDESGFSYIWYECVSAGCDEQFLEKRRMAAG